MNKDASFFWNHLETKVKEGNYPYIDFDTDTFLDILEYKSRCELPDKDILRTLNKNFTSQEQQKIRRLKKAQDLTTKPPKHVHKSKRKARAILECLPYEIDTMLSKKQINDFYKYLGMTDALDDEPVELTEYERKVQRERRAYKRKHGIF